MWLEGYPDPVRRRRCQLWPLALSRHTQHHAWHASRLVCNGIQGRTKQRNV